MLGQQARPGCSPPSEAFSILLLSSRRKREKKKKEESEKLYCSVIYMRVTQGTLIPETFFPVITATG